ncbi:MAG: diacylglycerol kinase family lipid kinase [Pirellulales bacterium]|nr:diacylglycerol kinase family lipid kinase [Pirellulales bacterium]
MAILFNPKAGPRDSRQRVERLAELLEKGRFTTAMYTDLDEAARQANRWHADGILRAFVGVGGDGTAAELINRTNEGVPLSFLPAGNSNLLAVYFKLSKDPETFCRTIADGVVAKVDAGEANGRLFALMVGCGFDADVVRRVHEHRGGHINLFSYGKPILKSIGGYEFPELRIQWDESDETGPEAARWLFAFNLPCYGGGLRIAPRADGSDGYLNVCCLKRGHFWPGLWYTAALLVRQHQRLRDFSMNKTRRLRITSDAEVPYQLDGDPGGALPLEIRSLPGRLTLIVPARAVTSSHDATMPRGRGG